MTSKIVSIDSGSSYLKAIYQGSEFCEQALISELPEYSEIDERIRYDDKWFVGGKRAFQQLATDAPKPDISDDFHGSLRQRIQIIYTLNKLGVTGKQDALILTLPWDDYYQKKGLRDQLKEMYKKLTWIDSNENQQSVEFENVFLTAQGTGAFHLYQKGLGNDKPESVILADIGSCTTDIISLQWDDEDEKFIYRENLSKSLKSISTGIFMDSLSSEILKQRPEKFEINYHYLDKQIRNEKFTIRDGSTEINFKQQFEEQKKVFSKLLKDTLKKELGQQFTTAEAVLIIGGGKSLITNWECTSKTEMFDHMANVRGQLEMVQEGLNS